MDSSTLPFRLHSLLIYALVWLLHLSISCSSYFINLVFALKWKCDVERQRGGVLVKRCSDPSCLTDARPRAVICLSAIWHRMRDERNGSSAPFCKMPGWIFPQFDFFCHKALFCVQSLYFRINFLITWSRVSFVKAKVCPAFLLITLFGMLP